MAASVKFDLWFFNTPEMESLIEQEGAISAQGVILQLFRYLRLCHNAIGNRRSLRKIARDCNCSEEWLWHIVSESGLFIIEDEDYFFSTYLSGILHSEPDKADASRKRRHARNCASAPYNEDNKNNHDNDDKENNKAYLGYDRAYGGRRYGYLGEPIPPDAPEQTNQDTRWSWLHQQWIPRARWSPKREKKEYERITHKRYEEYKQ